jgi:RNA polymerase sigma factor (sigma-70 family)
MSSDDTSLLREYVMENSEAAFGELVQRYVNLVHSAALRQVGGDRHRAQDVTQAVFCELARKAPCLLKHRALGGWLYTTASFVGARLRRSEARRTAREWTSHAMAQVFEQATNEPPWNDLEPILDKAMEQLGEKDRFAIVLRFFEDKPLAEVGIGLGVSENAARMRVERAIEKLRSVLGRRGFKSSASALGTILVANAVAPAPATLAASLVGPGLASAAAGSAASTGMTVGLLGLMNSTKLGIGLAAVVIAGGVGTYIEMRSNAARREEAIARQVQTAPPVSPVPESSSPVAPTINDGELAKLRGEHAELVRLRGEIGVLRQNQAELAHVREVEAEQARTEAVAAEDLVRRSHEAIGLEKLNLTREWFAGFEAFARENGGKMPETLDQAARYVPQKFLEQGPDIYDFEIVFRGSLSDIQGSPARSIILREKQPFNVEQSGEASRAYLFADGHSEVHIAPDGDFVPWEQQRMVSAVK